MGILNVTPDSFSDGGDFLDPDDARARAGQMVEQGAALIDIGGASSRPGGKVYGEGAELVPAEEEWRRIGPVIERVSEAHPDVWMSVDTFRSDVARKALKAGAHIINDITALRFDVNLASVAADFGAPVCLMHSIGMPGEMSHTASFDDVVSEVRGELLRAADLAAAAGVNDIILDPGFGFGKSLEDNLRLLARTDALVDAGYPVLVGISRKSSIGAALEPDGDPRPVDQRLFGSLGATAVAVSGGATIVRTHDVRETVDFLRLMDRTARYRDA